MNTDTTNTQPEPNPDPKPKRYPHNLTNCISHMRDLQGRLIDLGEFVVNSTMLNDDSFATKVRAMTDDEICEWQGSARLEIFGQIVGMLTNAKHTWNVLTEEKAELDRENAARDKRLSELCVQVAIIRQRLREGGRKRDPKERAKVLDACIDTLGDELRKYLGHLQGGET